MGLLIPLALCLISQTQPGSGLLGAKEAAGMLGTGDPNALMRAKEAVFFGDIESYARRSDSLPPKEAATQWLALIGEGLKVPHYTIQGSYFGAPPEWGGSFRNVAAALPRPEVWPEIVAIVSKRTESASNLALLMLFARLGGDDRELLRLCDLTSKQPSKIGYESADAAILPVRLGIFVRSGALEEGLEAVAKAEQAGTVVNLALPDLVTLLGEKKAESWVARLNKVPQRGIWFQGAKTQALDAKINPQHSDDDDNNHLVDLVSHGKVEDAVAFLPHLKDPRQLSFGDDGSASTGYPADLYKTVTEVQRRAPQVDIWGLRATAAKASGHTAEVADELENALETPGKDLNRAHGDMDVLIDLHSAMGDVAGLERDYTKLNSRPFAPEPSTYYEDPLLRLAVAIGDSPGLQEAIEKDLTTVDGYNDDELIEALLQTKRYSDIQRLLATRLKSEYAAGADRFDDRAGYDLCRLYYQADRPSDLPAVLNRYPYWSVSELNALDGGSTWGGFHFGDRSSEKLPPSYYGAWALEKAGNGKLAASVLETLIRNNDYFDEPYELLNRIEGPAALPLYGRQIAADPTGIRPLMWKGALLQSMGRLDEAEKCLREAIARDPSDANCPQGQRLKAFDLLANLLARKRDADGAAACRRRYEAARLSEKATALQEAGLWPQAAQTYKQALALAPSDYVIEEALSTCLAKQGLSAEADAHERKMFELLPLGSGPDSEVPQEFSSNNGWAVGLAVLEKMTPTGPTAFAKGLLEQFSSEPVAAAAAYEEALKLDPNFDQAWIKLSDLASGFVLDPSTRQAVAGRLPKFASNIPFTDWNSFEAAGPLADLYLSLDWALKAAPPTASFPIHGPGDPGKTSFGRMNSETMPAAAMMSNSDISAIVGAVDP